MGLPGRGCPFEDYCDETVVQKSAFMYFLRRGKEDLQVENSKFLGRDREKQSQRKSHGAEQGKDYRPVSS